MSQVYLTETQMRQLVAELRLVLTPPMAAKVERMHAELLELRDRESVSRFLNGTEPEHV